MTSTQPLTLSTATVRAKQRELRLISVDMLVDMVRLDVGEARQRVVASMLDDVEHAARIGALVDRVVAARTAADADLRAEWGL